MGGTPEHVKKLTEDALKEAQEVLSRAQVENLTSRSKRERQTIVEFTTMLGKEVQDAALQTAAEAGVHAKRTIRAARSMIEDHFQVDRTFRMLGLFRQDGNPARDVHDWFNLVALLPVIGFNIINWSCVSRFACLFNVGGLMTMDLSLPAPWHGEDPTTYMLFWWITFAYFIVDVSVVSYPS